MHVLVVTQYFWPENFRINDLVAALVERGHRVTVLTGVPNYPEGRFFDGYGIFGKRTEEYQGARVIRVPIVPRGRSGGVGLVLNYLSFVVSACMCAPLRCRDAYDLIFIFEPSPVTVTLPALFLKALRRIPVMFWVQDLWPESLAATGAVTSQKILDGVARMVRFIHRRCDRILVTSQAFREPIERLDGAPEHILYFPQSAEEIFRPHVDARAIPLLDDVPPGFWLMFAGNIGAAQDFQTIIAAADHLKGDPDIHWIIVGDGRVREWAEAEVCRRGLDATVHFLGRHPLETMPAFFARADALLVTLKRDPIFSLTIPAKIQSYLACGRPIIAALDGEGARIIDDSGAGFTCPAESPELLADVVKKMSSLSKTTREQMGIHGRNYYEQNFDRGMLLDKLESWMNDLVAEYRAKVSL